MSTDNATIVPAVDNALKLLKYMASRGGSHGVAPLARATGITVSSTFNILKTLVRSGFVTFDPKDKTYRIGMGILEIVAPVLGANPNDLIRPLLDGMAEEFNVPIALWQVTEHERIILIDQVAPRRIVHANIERESRLPAWSGAVGRCYAAHMGKDRADVRRGYESVRWQNPPGFDAYWASVEVARRDGFAFDFGNLFAGLDICAAMVCDAMDRPRLGISTIAITGQTDREQLQHVARRLAEAAAIIEINVFGRKANCPAT